jgi:T5SS/PEP-CTERM-associated repeat protein
MFWRAGRGDGSGVFNSATNWTPSLPGFDDVAHFGVTPSDLTPATYTVTFTAGVENKSLVIEDDRVIFNLNGQIYRTFTSNAAVNAIGTVSGRSGRLTLLNGTWDDPGNGLTFLGGGGLSGTLVVSTGARFVGPAFYVGSSGPGALQILNGGLVESLGARIGADVAPGTVTVAGTSSKWTNTGSLFVGRQSPGTLNVTAGGRLENTGSFSVGAIAGAVGIVNVDGIDSLWTNVGFVTLGSAPEINSSGEGRVNITAGGRAQLSALDVGSRGVGIVAVDGPNSQLTTADLDVGVGGQGKLHVSNGGLVRSAGIFFFVGTGESSAASGEVTISGGGRLEVKSSILGSDFGVGAATVSGAESQWIHSGNLDVTVGGTLTISDAGKVSSANGKLGRGEFASPGAGVVTVKGAGSAWVNSGTLTVGDLNGGALNIDAGGLVQNTSAIVGKLGAGAIVVDGLGSQWVSSADVQVGSGGQGRVTLRNAGTVRAQNLLLDSSGVLAGNGVVVGNIQNNGAVAPGESTGVLQFMGSYTQQSGGTLEIELGGLAPGAQHDFLDVQGNVVLGGHLSLSVVNGFVPAAADTLAVLDASSVAGAFANVANGQRLTTADGLGSFLVSYGSGSPFNPNQIVLSGFVPKINGDFDFDGDVDGNDFLIWQRGDSPTPLSATDLAAWRTNFGRTGAAAASRDVPEPSGGALLLSGLLLLLVRTRKGVLRGGN